MNDDVFFSGIAKLSQLLRARQVSSLELTRAYLERLETLGHRFNAVAAIAHERAEKEARRADRMLRAGRNTSSLCGIPYAVKDVLATKGVPTAWGLANLRERVLDYDATVVERLGWAGAVLMGKLALPQFSGVPGYGSGLASIYGPMRNPWDPERWAGGSSSGSAAAVAAGMAPFAMGAETWASIIGPAAFCGVTGLRPTFGLVSRFGAMPVAWSMDKIGPFTRSARDCGIVLAAIAGEDARDATTAFRPVFRFQQRIVKRPFRLGVLPASASPSPGVMPAFEEALRVLRHEGMRTRATRIPREKWGEVGIPIIHCEEVASQRELAQTIKLEDIVDDNQRESMRKFQVRGPAFTIEQYIHATEKRPGLIRNLVRYLEDYDALVAPTEYTEAPPVGQALGIAFAGKGGHGDGIGAIAGVPELVIPMGSGEHGMPLGLSLIGPLFSENTLLQIGMIFQRETDWHLRRPPVQAR